jgi:hypothetical protein
VPCAVAWWKRRLKPLDQAAIVLAAATLAAPIVRMAYLALALPALVAGVRLLRRRRIAAPAPR